MGYPAALLFDAVAAFEGWKAADDLGAPVHAGHRALLERVREGDEKAFEALVLELAGPLEAYGRRFTGTRDAARDVVQDVFAHLWLQRETVRVRGSVRAYLYTSVRNRALDVRKSERAESARWGQGESPDVPVGMGVGSAAPDAGVYRREIVQRVRAAIDALPPRARETALLRWRDGLGREEIAAVMGVSIPTVNNQLTLAARVVRELLADLRNPS